MTQSGKYHPCRELRQTSQAAPPPALTTRRRSSPRGRSLFVPVHWRGRMSGPGGDAATWKAYFGGDIVFGRDNRNHALLIDFLFKSSCSIRPPAAVLHPNSSYEAQNVWLCPKSNRTPCRAHCRRRLHVAKGRYDSGQTNCRTSDEK